MNIDTFIVDAFTDVPFKGNPAGVCLLENILSDEQMQSIATELGFSETAFVHFIDASQNYSIRYFSPKMEIPLCGHATLASSKVLFEKHPELEHIEFLTVEKLELQISRVGTHIQMEFPVYHTSPADVPDELLRALGISSIVNSAYNAETNILVLEIVDSHILEALQPDFEALVKSHDTINGVLVTAPSQRSGYDFESRYFWPWSGTNEDPVTGGTHTFLTPYWAKRLNKTKLNSFQCSARSGFMEVELTADSKLTITSQACIVIRGEMDLNY